MEPMSPAPAKASAVTEGSVPQASEPFGMQFLELVQESPTGGYWYLTASSSWRWVVSWWIFWDLQLQVDDTVWDWI
jgi:hypothetical protein